MGAERFFGDVSALRWLVSGAPGFRGVTKSVARDLTGALRLYCGPGPGVFQHLRGHLFTYRTHPSSILVVNK